MVSLIKFQAPPTFSWKTGRIRPVGSNDTRLRQSKTDVETQKKSKFWHAPRGASKKEPLPQQGEVVPVYDPTIPLDQHGGDSGSSGWPGGCSSGRAENCITERIFETRICETPGNEIAQKETRNKQSSGRTYVGTVRTGKGEKTRKERRRQ